MILEQPLTVRQIQIVVHIANGKRPDEIAIMMNLSVSSINATLGTARRRAGAKTLPHLVSMCIADGILEWTDGEAKPA
jgi:DNA-binding CsgD family transcriptional regulator